METSDHVGDAPNLSLDVFSCNQCPREFLRLDHLKRHSQTHRQEKPVKCGHCGKQFARKDAAQRHEQLHGNPEQSRPPMKLRRTCASCSKSRVKCSGGVPCRHCATRDLECSYQPRKRRSTTYSAESASGRQTESTALVIATEVTSEDPRSEIDDSTYAEQWEGASPVLTGQSGEVPVADLTNQQSGSQQRLTAPWATVIISTPHDEFTPSDVTSMITTIPEEVPIATNWLPFDHASVSGMSSAFPDQHQATSEGAHLDSGIGQSPGTWTRQNDQVSALITYMRDRSPVGSPPNGDTSDSLPRRRLYAEGAGFRHSQADRHFLERQSVLSRRGLSSEGQRQSRLPWAKVLQDEVRHSQTQSTQPRFQIPESIFQEVLLKLVPREGTTFLSSVFMAQSSVLLARDVWNYLIQLYFENFHTIYPFLDRSLLCIPVWGWSLCIATAAIGSRYLGLPELTTFGEELCGALHELLLIELSFGRLQDSLPYIQARTLAAIGLCQSQLPQHIKCGYAALSLVYNSSLQLQVFDEDDKIGSYREGQSVEQVWLAWRFRETRRRTGLFLWLLDSCFAFATEHPPSMPSKKLKLRLPSPDDLWEAESVQNWFKSFKSPAEADTTLERLLAEEAKRPTVKEATDSLWANLCAPDSATPQFGTILILHYLLRRRWDASQYLSDPLFHSDQTLQEGNTDAAEEKYLGGVSEYAKWRNCTCDCLDALHFNSFGHSIRRGGFEGPIILHLHFSRLAILAPIREIFEYAHEHMNESSSHFLPHYLYHQHGSDTKYRNTIFTWIHKDRYKARLAVIHAGAMFWHVRRYSSNSIIEPFAIFLAALVLWVFGSLSQIEQQEGCESNRNRERESPESEASVRSTRRSPHKAMRRMPGTITLDRPVDDELVQYFIRCGESMQISLEGVDNLYSSQGPLQILREAVGVLVEQPMVWTISESYATYLDAIVCQSERAQESLI